MAGTVPITPLVEAPTLSELLGCRILLKLENMQRTGSFKERGALTRLQSLTPKQRRIGVIAMSAGNHAQGVACHAGRLGIPATIVMPEGTPFTKVARTEAYGAQVVLHGATLAEAAAHAHERAAADGLLFVHPYDDFDVIRGQGTIGLEMLQQAPDLDVLVVPIGGGGLISGIAIAAKGIKSDIRVFGVQSELYPSMRQALAGVPIICGGATIAEGIAVAAPGTIAQSVARDLVEDIILVSETTLEQAIFQLLTVQKIVAEGAGAAGLAAIMSRPAAFRGATVGLVVCGGNIDARLLASVLMRGLVRDGRLVRLRIKIADAPGELARVTQVVGESGGNIVEVFHQRLFHNVPIKLADLDIMIETRDASHVQTILKRLGEERFQAQLMTDIS